MDGIDIFKRYQEGELSTTELREILMQQQNQKNIKQVLSEGQKGLWVLHKLNPDMSAYNLPVCFRVGKKLDISLFKQALLHISKQNPILKTVIGEVDKIPYQMIDENQPLYFEVCDISDIDSNDKLSYIKNVAKEPFDLNKGPLMRVYVFQNVKEDIVLMNIHHIIFDGHSMMLLIGALLDTYSNILKGESPKVDSPSCTFYDFVKWEQEMLSSHRGDAHRHYWKNQLSGKLPKLDLPKSNRTTQAGSFEGETYHIKIVEERAERIGAFLKINLINTSAFFLGLLKFMLYQYSQQEELIVGMANIVRPEERFDSVIGYFINMLPIRSRIETDKTFIDFLKTLQLNIYDAIDHGDYPFQVMVRELEQKHREAYSPVFQVGYFYQNFIRANSKEQMDNQMESINMAFIDEIHQEGEYELALEVFEEENGFNLNVKYHLGLYDKTFIKSMTESLIALMDKVLEDGDKPIEAYKTLHQNAFGKVLNEWNATEEAFDINKTLTELFQEQVNKTPDAIAVVYEGMVLTYRELDEKSTKMAIYLQQLGVKANELVGICVERSLDMIIGLLGIMKSGGCYIPLDPEYPSERLKYMIGDSKINILITQSNLKDKTDSLLSSNVKGIFIDKSWNTIDQVGCEHELISQVSADQLAYVIYTSGSTGNPKGVMIPHKALINFLLSMTNKLSITDKDELLAITTFSFDIAGLELYLPIINGATCHICSTEKQKNIEKLKLEIERVKPTIMQGTPVTWSTLFMIGWKNEEKVKILCGGEALPQRLKDFFVSTGSEAWNMFGPTETTIWSSMKRINGDEPITIGKPIANTTMYVLDKNMNPVPIGVDGELYIGGLGLAAGYLNLPEMTQERFIMNPFVEGAKIYKTGDLAKWLPTGEIAFGGRIDSQVKMHGFRIELGEIENRLNMHPAIMESAVVVSDNNNNKQLKAFYVRKKDAEQPLDAKTLRQYLKKYLSAYMIPSTFTELEAIPLTPNGKINRLELSKYRSASIQKRAVQREQDIERTVLEIWKKVIDTDKIEIEDGFFEVGGDSITAVIVAEQITEVYGCDIKVTEIFEYSTVKAIAEFISEYLESCKTEQQVQVDAEGTVSTSVDEISDNEYPSYYKDSVAIIGISCQFPEAKNYNEFWDNLMKGKEGVRKLTMEELKVLNVPDEILKHPKFVPVQQTIEDKDIFDPEFFMISYRDAESMDPQMRMLLQNAWKAVEDAGYVPEEITNTAVYMSTSNNFYQAPDESTDYNILESPTSYVSWLLGQGGTVPTMVSYQLGLKGPSYSVHSNCSSSLVGMYEGYKSVQSGEVDYALVGASTIHASEPAGHIHLPGLNFSSDGHIRTFDASADGMIGAEGVAVIMLKNAIQAIEDGDNIYALIRGIGVNNDGADKVGFYAPSVKGQTDVIDKVLKSAEIDVETIDFIEAHGTGTKIGDPIEVSSLTKIYRKYTDKKQYCGIGSVKTNIGHLDTAAGLAGCIKIALSLYNKHVPPTLNYEKANKEIDFEQSPFYVLDKGKDLNEDNKPYRAALSAFGIGGTNVHAIFENYSRPEEQVKQNKEGSVQIIPISARKKERLKEYVKTLHEFLKNKTDLDIRNIAYTLQVGRKAMESRVAFLSDNVEDLVQQLELYLGNDANDNFVEDINKIVDESTLKITFDKANIITQNINNDNETANKTQKASYSSIDNWIAQGEMKNIATAWVNGYTMNWLWLYEEEKPNRISLPTYPFAKDRYWKTRTGPKKTTQTAMAQVSKLHPLIDRNISDFIEQKYTMNLMGESYYLADHIIQDNKVLPGVVHVEMGRAAGQLAVNQKIHAIKNVVWSRPIIVDEPRDVDVVLELQGDEIAYAIQTYEQGEKIIHSQGKLAYLGATEYVPPADQVLDIEACKARAQHIIEHEDFYESGENNGYDYGPTFRPIREMYVGDKEVLTRIAVPERLYEDFDQYTLHPSLLEGCLQSIVGLMGSTEITPFMPFAIEEINIIDKFPKEGYVYATLADSDKSSIGTMRFNMTFVDAQGKPVAIVKKYSIRTITKEAENKNTVENHLDTVCFHNEWTEKPLNNNVEPVAMDGNVLIFCDNETIDEQLKLDNAIIVKAGDVYQKQRDNRFMINPSNIEDYKTLLEALKKSNANVKNILHMWSYSQPKTVVSIMNRGIYSMFNLCKALAQQGLKDKVTMTFIYGASNEIDTALNSALDGFMQSLKQEQPKLAVKMLGLDRDENSLRKTIFSELASNNKEVYYQGNRRMIKQFVERKLYEVAEDAPVPFRYKGVYLITGGMGGLGKILAKYLSSEYNARLILIGRSDLDEKKKAFIEELELEGSEVLYVKGDISVKQDVLNIINEGRSRFYSIHGIIHCAGLLNDNLLIKKTYADMREVLLPKVDGTLCLDEVTADENLDFFLLFSSISSLGNRGQSDYAYANSFLNTFAELREQKRMKNERYGKTMSICWTIWENGGMSVSPEALKFLTNVKGIHPMTATAGVKVIEKGLLTGNSHLFAYYGDIEKIRRSNQVESKEIENERVVPVSQPVKTDGKQVFNHVKNFLVNAASSLLKIKNMDIDRDLEQYGFDSISHTEFTNKINDEYAIDLMPTVFFELAEPTIRALTQYLCDKYEAKIIKIKKLGEEKQSTQINNNPINTNNEQLKSLKEVSKSNIKNLNMQSRFNKNMIGEVPNYNNFNDAFYNDESNTINANSSASIIDQKHNDRNELVAIIGMSGIFPQSENLDEFWDNLINERSLITEIPEDRFDWKQFNDEKVRWGGFMKEVDKFDADFFDISPQEAEVMDPQHRLFLQVAWSTIEDAGYKASDLSGTDTGIFVGVGTQDYSEILENNLVWNNPYALTGRTPFMLVNRLSSMLNLHGPSEPIDTACSSSLVAVHKAAEAIRNGNCNMAIAGGSNVIITPKVHLAFSKAGMLNETGVCKVFDEEADGTLRGEGVGAILLKSLSAAVDDGDHIYGVIRSSGQNHKGKSASLTAPNANSQSDLLISVYEKAKIDPTTISFIEAHSTGTRLGDPIEINGLKKAFNTLYKKHGIDTVKAHCAIGSVKANIGHMEAAAGIGSVIKVLLSMKHKTLLGTLNINKLNPYINLDNSPLYINQKTCSWDVEESIPRRAGVSAFGFGGVNAHVMLEEYLPETYGFEKQSTSEASPLDHDPAVIVLSAKNEERLRVQAQLLLDAIENENLRDSDMMNIAYTLQNGREAMDERLGFTVETIQELKDKLTSFIIGNDGLAQLFFRGRVVEESEVMSVLTEDAGMENVIRGWMINSDYSKLLRLWVRGLKVNWSEMYRDVQLQRLSLPTYPFEKTRHWLDPEGEVQDHEVYNIGKKQKTKPQANIINTGSETTAKEKVLRILTKLLGHEIKQSHMHYGLSEMGIDSIILTQLLQQLQVIDQSIDFESLYLCQSIKDIIGLLEANEVSLRKEKTYYPELIRLNKGNDELPVFWLHGGFGGVEIYREVAKMVKRPFYGIQAKGYLTEDEPIEGIENMAEYYVEIIKSVQPEGPYDLGGLSLGGTVAYEVARQLQAMGDEIRSIVMLESIYVEERMKQDWASMKSSDLKKDRMLRAVNLLLAFSSSEELVLIADKELNINVSDEAFLEDLVKIAVEKGAKKSPYQLSQAISQLERILYALDKSTAEYEPIDFEDRHGLQSYYFCNITGSLFGEEEQYFRLVDKERVYDYRIFAEKWKEKLPTLSTLKVTSSNHLTLLTDAESKEVIMTFCDQLYNRGLVSQEYLESLLLS